MATKIRIIGETDEELAELGDWLVHDRELSGQVIVSGEDSEIEPGTSIELVTATAAVGALASSLRAWLTTRRTTLTITAKTAGKSFSLTVDGNAVTVADVAAFLELALKLTDD